MSEGKAVGRVAITLKNSCFVTIINSHVQPPIGVSGELRGAAVPSFTTLAPSAGSRQRCLRLRCKTAAVLSA